MVDEKSLMELVASLREAMNLSQAHFAVKIHKSYATVQNYEQSGRIPATELWVFIELARKHGHLALAERFKTAMLENLPPQLISIIKEPQGHGEEADSKSAVDKGGVRARRYKPTGT